MTGTGACPTPAFCLPNSEQLAQPSRVRAQRHEVVEVDGLVPADRLHAGNADEDGRRALLVPGETVPGVVGRSIRGVEVLAEDFICAAMRRADWGVDGHEVTWLEVREDADPFALGFGAGFFVEVEVLRPHRAIHVRADELMVLDPAAFAVQR